MEEEKAIFRSLSSPTLVDIQNPVFRTVIDRLLWVASEMEGLSALIDVGATLTALSNKQVAAALLVLGLPDHDGVVFLDSTDRKLVLLRPPQMKTGKGDRVNKFSSVEELKSSVVFQQLAAAAPITLERCGIPRSRLFVFFDQIHCTGVHIGMIQAKD